MKKLWKVTLWAIALLSALLVLGGCGGNKPKEDPDKKPGGGTHTCVGETVVIEKEATCKEEGSKKLVCSCGKTVKTEVIPLGGHTEETVPGKDATCEETGLTDGKKCSVCGEILLAQTEIPIAAHTYDNASDASCNVCGFVRDVNCSHSSQITIAGYAATCTETGLTDGKKCSVCQAMVVSQEVLTALGHDEISHVAQVPTCTEIGWDAYVTCSRCTYTTYAEKPAGHNMTNGVCSLCGYSCWEIRTVADLQNITLNLSGSYVLMNDLDLGGMEWTPIVYFTGIFDGSGHVISGFKITGDVMYAGLFGLSVGEIKNLGLQSFSIELSCSDVVYAGGLVGCNEDGTITNCYATGDVSASTTSSNGDVYVGGLVGINGGTITNCYTTGDINVSATSSNDDVYAGGLVGGNFDGIIENSYAMGDVSSTHTAGGLLGYNLGQYCPTITNSYATGAVSAGRVGGLIGCSETGNITNCYATGDVSGTSSSSNAFAGGLVGAQGKGAITNCYATGDVSASSTSSSFSARVYAGGLVSGGGGTITNCYATGDVSSSATNDFHVCAGGLSGYNFGTITNCYATGDVSSSAINSTTHPYGGCFTYAGGLVGWNQNGLITNCYGVGDVSSRTTFMEGFVYHAYAGGLIGHNDAGTITNSYRYSGQSFTVTNNGTTTYKATNTEGTAKDMPTLQSVDFQQNTLGWSSDDWNFTEGAHPTLK